LGRGGIMSKKFYKFSPEELADILKILAHPTRLKILKYLFEEPHCVCKLLEKINVSQPNLSQHLALLRNTGFIKDEKQGNMVLYHLIKTPVIETILSFLALEKEVEIK
jgi:ArsR family transcriptional regulator